MEGIKQGIGQGIEQGELKKAHEIAANMLKDGMPPEKAKSYVDLGDDQWNELLKSLGMSDQAVPGPQSIIKILLRKGRF